MKLTKFHQFHNLKLKLNLNLKQINYKEILVDLYKDVFLYDIVYNYKSRDSYACLLVRSFEGDF